METRIKYIKINKNGWCYADGNIQKGTWFIDSFILAFPSEEMRDAFCENFKKDIEQCNEFL